LLAIQDLIGSQVTALIDQLYSQVEKAGGERWDTSSLIHNLRLLD
jgi:3-hydroxyisobutyrate dehydrogenase